MEHFRATRPSVYRVRIEQQALHRSRKVRMNKHLFEVIDKMGTPKHANPVDLGIACRLEKNAAPVQPDAIGLEEAVTGEPVKGVITQVDLLAIENTMFCLVTDDARLQAATPAFLQKFQRTLERFSADYAFTIYIRLELYPPVLAVGQLAYEIAYGFLVAPRCCRDQTGIHRAPVDQFIVADQGVIEVDTDDVGGLRSVGRHRHTAGDAGRPVT